LFSQDEQDYIEEIQQREGIIMNLSAIKKNPVQRTIAKLFLNWGKFAQRLALPKTQYLSEEELQEKLKDSTQEIKGIELLQQKLQDVIRRCTHIIIRAIDLILLRN
jgi:hypothetical protein